MVETVQEIAVTIPALSSISTAATLTLGSLYAIQIGGMFTGDEISLVVSQDGGLTWNDALLNGNEFVIGAASGVRIQLDTADWEGVTDVKVRAGSSQTPINQAYEVTIYVISAGEAPPPPIPLPSNPGRVINYFYIGQSGLFAPYYVSDDGVATFNLTGLLQSGETIESITSFVLLPEGPYCTNDTDSASRVLIAPQIAGKLVNVELGNWQQDVRFIRYAAKLVYATNYTPEQTVLGIVQVIQLAPYPQNPPCVGGDGVVWSWPFFPQWWDR